MSEQLSGYLRDEELISRLGNTEDNFVERKRFSDDREWLRTVVGFANSCPIGYPGILFIGVYDSGAPEKPKKPINLDSLQKTFGERMNEAWPPVYYLTRVIEKDGQQILAVLVPGSAARPHFAGLSYVRVGCETKKASETQFDELVAYRNSKASAILNWKDRDITIERTYAGRSGRYPATATVVACNAFYVTLLLGRAYSFSLEAVRISYDDEAQRLRLHIHELTV